MLPPPEVAPPVDPPVVVVVVLCWPFVIAFDVVDDVHGCQMKSAIAAMTTMPMMRTTPVLLEDELLLSIDGPSV